MYYLLLAYSEIETPLKAKKTLHPDDEAQPYNYLNATTVEVGMLLDFGEEPEHKRRVLTNDKKSFLNQK